MARLSATLCILCSFNVLQTLSLQKSLFQTRAQGDKGSDRKNTDDRMQLSVLNVTATSATVAWLPLPGGCRGGFYSVMFHPNWNSLLTGHGHRNFLRKSAVPAGQTSASLGDLSPHTNYVLCVMCQAPAVPALPSRERCRVFRTLEEAEPESGAWGAAGSELAMGVWLTSALLLAVIACVLLYGGLRACCYWDCDLNGNGSEKGETGRPHSSSHKVGGPGAVSFDGSPSRQAVTLPLCEQAPELMPLSMWADAGEHRATP